VGHIDPVGLVGLRQTGSPEIDSPIALDVDHAFVCDPGDGRWCGRRRTMVHWPPDATGAKVQGHLLRYRTRTDNMPSRDSSTSHGDRVVDLAETRRRFLFACEHLAAHAPSGCPPHMLRTCAAVEDLIVVGTD
jgi:hypothetical protein